jgi:hypothetical protein
MAIGREPNPTELLPNLRRLIHSAAEERRIACRENLRTLMVRTGHDAVTIQALTGLSAGTVRNFLRGTDSSVGNVLLIALALGVTLGDIERPPAEFRRLIDSRDIA